ncbi:sterile alpha motif domain-containing protein 11 [Monodon monoceros]|uniref:sterile alpha motif domain-containing protein 11 n=1 Tax=Monodon monoceros TaxID=40151 RepID=UPI0010F9BA23|nr:sterile alpha motif domain-containing protein 11 [Monodon monoceros]
MPAVKKELPGREDLALALATFHPTLAALPLPPLPGYLAPLPAAAALPPAASLPAATAGYEALLPPPLRAPRAYLSLHEAAPHLHLPRDPLALERFSATAAAAPDFQPLLDNGEPCIEVECGANRALLYVRKLCQGSKGPSIRHRGEWLTPNEFQFVSGRETAKDWKRSIRHKGKSLKTLMSKGILQVHPPICDCPGCRISSPVNRGRLADKRTVALPPARVLKKELTPSFSASGDSDRSGPACGQRLGLKQEDDPHVRIMKRRVHTHWDVNISFRETSCSQDSDLPTLISSLRRSRHLVMPEHQSRCEFQRGSVEVGLGAAGDLLGKRLGRSPHVSGDCPSEKKARSKSPQEGPLLPELGPGMAPEDHYRRLVSALSEAGTFEDPQRLYHLGLPGHDSPNWASTGHCHFTDEEAKSREPTREWEKQDGRRFRFGRPAFTSAQSAMPIPPGSQMGRLEAPLPPRGHSPAPCPAAPELCRPQSGGWGRGLAFSGWNWCPPGPPPKTGGCHQRALHWDVWCRPCPMAFCSSFCPGDEPAGSVGECAPGLRVLGQCTTGCGGREGLVGAGLWVTAAAAPSSDLLRVQQEVAAAAARSPSGLEVHLPSSTAGQRRKQGLAQHRDITAPAGAPSFSERELSQPPPLLSPQNAPHIALGPHLRPPFLGVPSALCQTPGYGFLPPAQAEMLARQQELLRKQNLARLEMSAELLRQKELESAHRPQLLAPEAALRPPDGAEELRRRGAMLVLRHSSAPLLALPPQGPPGPGPPTPPQEPARRAPRKGGPSPASARPSEPKETTGAGLWAQDGSEDEPPKDSDGEDPEMVAAGGQGPTGGASSEGKGLASGSMLPPPLPLGLPYTVSPYFHTGATGGLFMDGEGATAPEDVSKWTVDDVCSFVGGLSGCGEYAPVFREQGIDGETLPLLTEEHLLTTMGLKLGPALKIRAQVAKRLGRVFYMASFPVALPLQPPTLRVPERELNSREQPLSPAPAPSPYGGAQPPASRASPKQENGTMALLPGPADPSQPLC